MFASSNLDNLSGEEYGNNNRITTEDREDAHGHLVRGQLMAPEEKTPPRGRQDLEKNGMINPVVTLRMSLEALETRHEMTSLCRTLAWTLPPLPEPPEQTEDHMVTPSAPGLVWWQLTLTPSAGRGF